MQINSENGFQKYANGKTLWPNPIYRLNNGHFSCILVELAECAAHGPNVLPTQKDFFPSFILPIYRTPWIAIKYKLKIKIVEHPTVKAWIIANCIDLYMQVFEWVIFYHIKWFGNELPIVSFFWMSLFTTIVLFCKEFRKKLFDGYGYIKTKSILYKKNVKPFKHLNNLQYN